MEGSVLLHLHPKIERIFPPFLRAGPPGVVVVGSAMASSLTMMFVFELLKMLLVLMVSIKVVALVLTGLVAEMLLLLLLLP